ncbi:H-NS histone family protein [Endozoicomonadaceae bacterium StTr2]
MNIFEEVIHRLGSKTRIRSLFKDVHLEDMESMISRMNEVLEEKYQHRKKEELRRQEKQNSIEEIKKVMAHHGLTLDDFGDNPEKATVPARKKRNIKKFTFEYVDQAGDTVQWHGSTTGRLPKDFQVYLEKSGKKRTDCVVEQ